MQPTLKGNDVVEFNNRGVMLHALVAQSLIANVPTPQSAEYPAGIRYEEHATLVYLKPEMLQYLMSGVDVARAITTVMSIQILPEHPKEQPLFPYAVLLQEAEPHVVNAKAHPELIQDSPTYSPQVPVLQSRVTPGKIMGTVYREDNPDGGVRQTSASDPNLPPHTVPSREEWAKAGYTPESYDERFVERDGVLVDTIFDGVADQPEEPSGAPPRIDAAEWDSWPQERKDEWLKIHPDTIIEDHSKESVPETAPAA